MEETTFCAQFQQPFNMVVSGELSPPPGVFRVGIDIYILL